jgi:deoxycytidylate deaminase
MSFGLIVGNRCVHVGLSSPAPGARMKGGSFNALQSTPRHAEMDALRWMRRHQVRKAELVVVRRKKDGRYGDSRPCVHCIKRIVRYHSNIISVTLFEGGEWITERPDLCAKSSKLSSADNVRMHLQPWEHITLHHVPRQTMNQGTRWQHCRHHDLFHGSDDFSFIFHATNPVENSWMSSQRPFSKNQVKLHTNDIEEGSI